MFSLLALTSLTLITAEGLQDTCENAPAPHRAALRHIESKGIGYGQGYTSVDLFVASNQPMHSLVPFVDARFHIFNNGLPAVNAGMGLRYIAPSWVYGINSYYDYRKTHRFHYNQVACGLEALGKAWDIRLNGYLPVGKKKSPFFNTKFSHFKEHHAFLSSKQEFAMRGLNLEAGYHFKKMKHVHFYTAAGPYYFYNEGQNAIGAEARVSATIYNYLKLEVNGSYDPIFHGIGQGQLSLILPFGPRARVSPRKGQSCSNQLRARIQPRQEDSSSNQLVLRERALQPVDRSEIIVLDAKRHITTAINPDTNSPFTFFFVNNLSHSNGTYESPFTTLSQAQAGTNPGDIIYVYPGSGAAYSTITLQNNQKLWGSGTRQNLDTTLGTVGIANQTGGMPLLSYGANALGIVTLANNNEVRGMHINGLSGTTGYGILGGDGAGTPTNTALNITNALIRNNLLDGTYRQSAVRIVGNGAAIVYQNTIHATVANAGDNYSGIEVFSLSYQLLRSTIHSNTITASSTGNTPFGITAQALGAGATTKASIYSNTITASNIGVAIGIFAAASGTGATTNASIYSNAITANNTSNLVYGIYALASTGATTNASIYSNAITASSTGCSVYGIYALASTGATTNASIYSNTITASNPGDCAFGIYAGTCCAGATTNASIYSNTITASSNTGITAVGIYALASTGSTTNASIYSNTITANSTGSTAYGIFATALTGAILKGNVDCNTGTVTGNAPGSKAINTTAAPNLIVGSNSIKLINN